MRKLLLLLVALASQTAYAQVYKCAGPGGNTVYSDAPCAGAVELPIQRSEPARPAGPAGPSDGTTSMRLEALQLMLANGKLVEARQFARTPQEFALVDRAAAQQAREAKAQRREREEAALRESSKRMIEGAKSTRP